MAFSFGTAAGFGAASAPAFGAASAPAFGAASAPAFGAASATGFGAANASAFGTPGLASNPSFAFSTAPATAAASSSAFGFASTPAASPSLFGANSSPSLFNAASTGTSLFGAASAAASTPAATSSMFSFGTAAGQASTLFGPAAGAQPASAVTYSARFEDLHPQVQKELQDIQREISTYRDDCDKLDRDQRLHDSAALKKSMEEETRALKRALEGLANQFKADDEALADIREKVMKLLRCTESAVRTYQRARLWREAPQQYKGQLIPPQVQELLSAPVVLPNPYLEMAIQGFADALDTYRQVVCELEAAVPADTLASVRAAQEAGNPAAIATTLPTIISHMHDYFVHVAALMEQLHVQVEGAKDAFLAQRQAAGDMSNPFADSRRHQAAAAQRPVVLPSAGHHHHHAHHHAHHLGQGHGAGHPLHAGTPHGPGGMPTPGAFGTPLPGMDASGAASPYGQGATAASGDPNRKQSKGRRK